MDPFVSNSFDAQTKPTESVEKSDSSTLVTPEPLINSHIQEVADTGKYSC